MKNKSLIVITLLFISSFFAGFFGSFTMERLGTEITKPIILTEDGLALKGYYVVPKERATSEPMPGVFLIHGLNIDYHCMEGIATDFARHGIAALALDLRGHGNSQGIFGLNVSLDLKAAVEWLKERPEVNANNISLLGYSLGGPLALYYLSFNPNIISTILVGHTPEAEGRGINFDFEINSTYPKNLLICVSQGDEFVSRSKAEEMISNATNGLVNSASVLFGNFSNGTARKLIYAKAISHLFEMYDKQIVSASIDWVRGANALPPMELRIITGWRDFFIIQGLFSFIGSLFFVSFWMVKGYKKLSLELHKRKRSENHCSDNSSFNSTHKKSEIILTYKEMVSLENAPAIVLEDRFLVEQIVAEEQLELWRLPLSMGLLVLLPFLSVGLFKCLDSTFNHALADFPLVVGSYGIPIFLIQMILLLAVILSGLFFGRIPKWYGSSSSREKVPVLAEVIFGVLVAAIFIIFGSGLLISTTVLNFAPVLRRFHLMIVSIVVMIPYTILQEVFLQPLCDPLLSENFGWVRYWFRYVFGIILPLLGMTLGFVVFFPANLETIYIFVLLFPLMAYVQVVLGGVAIIFRRERFGPIFSGIMNGIVLGWLFGSILRTIAV